MDQEALCYFFAQAIDMGLGDLLRALAQKRTVKVSMPSHSCGPGLRCGYHHFLGRIYDNDSAPLKSAMEGLINGTGRMRADVAAGLSKAVDVFGRSTPWSWGERGGDPGGSYL